MASFDAGERCDADREIVSNWNSHKVPYGTFNETTKQIADDCCSKCTQRCYKRKK